jgi:RimJ/RimL family protein N-acetyltransferase
MAVVGEFGFGRVIGVAESMKLPDQNMAEVAFSVSEEYKGKGLGAFFLKKLAAVARENGKSGLMAFTFPSNKAMIKLIKN